jgi:hypothetical protein
MKKIVSNQPHKGEVYYGARIYNKDGKYIGSHDGLRVTKKIRWFAKSFFDMFIDELIDKAKKTGTSVVVDHSHIKKHVKFIKP